MTQYLTAILVEDSQTICETLIPVLEELARTRVVAVATTSAEAKQALTDWDEKWDLIIVDLFLKAGSGLDVLQMVRTRSTSQHAFVLSNYATSEMRRRCLELGANGVYDKSTEIDVFVDQCLQVISRLHPQE